MSTRDEERQLWRIDDVECVMVSCCTGAELQVRRVQVRLKADATTAQKVDATSEGEIIVRELYPTKSDLYERARELESEFRSTRT